MWSPDPELPDTTLFVTNSSFSKFPILCFGFTGITQKAAGRYFGLMGICNGRQAGFLALQGERVKGLIVELSSD